MKEKRKYQRIRFGFKVEDSSSKKVWMTENISPGGCFLQTIENIPVGTKIDLVFQLPGSSKYIEAVGEVKRLERGGIGVEFVNMDSEGQKKTEDFVRDFIKFEE